MTIMTIGHSTLPQEQFAQLAIAAGVVAIVDVRSHPASKWPQFWLENLQQWLPKVGLDYSWMPGLGGWTRHHKDYIEPMREYGVDLQPYMGGKFPKQHIALRRNPDKDIDPACPLHGYSSHKAPEIPLDKSSGRAIRKDRYDQSSSGVHSRPHQRDPSAGSSSDHPRSTRNGPRNAPARDSAISPGNSQYEPAASLGPRCCDDSPAGPHGSADTRPGPEAGGIPHTSRTLHPGTPEAGPSCGDDHKSDISSCSSSSASRHTERIDRAPSASSCDGDMAGSPDTHETNSYRCTCGRRDARSSPEYSKNNDRPQWWSVGLRDYSFYMGTQEFIGAADTLIELGRHRNVAIMCAEALWWRCHRSMIADYLCYRDVESIHLQPRQTYHSRVIGDRLERYDPAIRLRWASGIGWSEP